jgi:hypothetical protein
MYVCCSHKCAPAAGIVCGNFAVFGTWIIFLNRISQWCSLSYYSIIVFVTITILDTKHRPVFYLKHNVVETGFCPRRQVETESLSSVCLSIWQNRICSTWRRRQNPVSETLCFKQKIGRWIMPRIVIVKYKYVRFTFAIVNVWSLVCISFLAIVCLKADINMVLNSVKYFAS